MRHPPRRILAAVRLGEQISIISRLWIICPLTRAHSASGRPQPMQQPARRTTGTGNSLVFSEFYFFRLRNARRATTAVIIRNKVLLYTRAVVTGHHQPIESDGLIIFSLSKIDGTASANRKINAYNAIQDRYLLKVFVMSFWLIIGWIARIIWAVGPVSN